MTRRAPTICLELSYAELDALLACTRGALAEDALRLRFIPNGAHTEAARHAVDRLEAYRRARLAADRGPVLPSRTW